ncbi:mitochondrial outer membrane import complex METAXIN [Olea europaea subsp. europaea]|uniref:Mitochondrial outer membrane import complex METAXIN n=1 Tax=Olea europaea subsp. europaea TaxID=158383 RepID=A0A8S0VK03_OLEEU|nr:mitochondrial outer membrane import complex METAXIN [Olea europaea subsp. europaea]
MLKAIKQSALTLVHLHLFLNQIPLNRLQGSKPKSKPKREKTEEEKKFRRRAKHILVTQLVAVIVFLTLLGGSDDAELDLEDDDDALKYD